MNKHTHVMVYQDPITRQKEEGRAFLLSKIRDEGIWEGRTLERWKVCFAGDDGGVYERSILSTKET